MKKFKLILMMAAAAFVGGLRDGFATANDAEAPTPDEQAAEIASLKAQLEASSEQLQTLLDAQTGLTSADEDSELALLKEQLAQQGVMIQALQAQAAAPAEAATVTVPGIGPFRLPEGVDASDVNWRMKAGLTAKQAVQAALQQVAHAAKKKALAAKAGTASAAPAPAAETATAGAS